MITDNDNLKRTIKYSYADFKNDILDSVIKYPSYIRYGQAIFLVLSKKYPKILADVIAEKPQLDCFYQNSLSEELMIAIYDKVIKCI